MDRIKTNFPNVEIMMCSGGGGRVDYGALSYAHEVWPSDMTDPVRRIFIQWGFSHFVPAIASAAHVTGWGDRPLKFCFDVAMSGRLGMDVDVSALSEDERTFAHWAIETYKSIREVVQLGDLYRLESPYLGRAALMYEYEGRAVLFVYASTGWASQPIVLKGLDADRRYTVRELNRLDGRTSSAPLDGASLLSTGLAIPEMSTFGSHVYEIFPS
jgi:alpha-galactosidase